MGVVGADYGKGGERENQWIGVVECGAVGWDIEKQTDLDLREKGG